MTVSGNAVGNGNLPGFTAHSLESARIPNPMEVEKYCLPSTSIAPPKWLRFLVITLLVVGIGFRFVNLGKKVYWYDEAFTSLRISGYQEAEVIQAAFTGQELHSPDLAKYQRPNSDRGIGGTITGLAREEPQHPPLYYVLVRFWAQAFGSSPAVIRSLSVLFSLLVFPAAYWLCWELVGSPTLGWVTIALLAVSPIQVVFAQEARQYSLWAATILASSASLLRARRLGTRGGWLTYGVMAAIALYTFLLTGLVLLGHGIYIVVTERFRWTATVGQYLRAIGTASLLFLPWILTLLLNLNSAQNTTAWATGRGTLFDTARIWILNLRRLFFDLDFDRSQGLVYVASVVLVYALVLGVQAYAWYVLCHHAPLRVWLFLVTLAGVTAAAVLLPDVILGGQRSTATRYLMPVYLGIHLAVAYALSVELTMSPFKRWRRGLAQSALVGLAVLGIASCVVSAQSETWWNKVLSFYNPAIARIVNQAPQPLLICATSDRLMRVGDVLSISRLLDPKVTLQLVVAPQVPRIRDGFSDVFLMVNSGKVRRAIAQQRNITVKALHQQDGSTYLWKLE